MLLGLRRMQACPAADSRATWHFLLGSGADVLVTLYTGGDKTFATASASDAWRQPIPEGRHV